VAAIKPKLTLKSARKSTNSPINEVQGTATEKSSQVDQAEEASQSTVARKRYRVTPKADDAAARSRKPARRRSAAKGAGQGARRTTRDPAPKKLPDDPDHQWLKRELRAADTVAKVMARQAQFENKIRALKLRHPPEKPLYQYAERMEAFLKRLATYPWTAQLRDIRQDDAQVRKLKL
jgi:hypothetical protein